MNHRFMLLNTTGLLSLIITIIDSTYKKCYVDIMLFRFVPFKISGFLSLVFAIFDTAQIVGYVDIMKLTL